MSAKATWMSGGSGSGVYDPVTTGDSSVQYTDQDEGWLRFKGRKYNFGTYRNSGLKGLCDDVRNRTRPKCLLIGFISTVLFLLLIAIIVIASSRDSSPKPFENWVRKPTGLNFEPPGQEGTVFLPFSLEDGKEESYLRYTTKLDAALEKYKTTYLHNGSTVLCNSTYAPRDKVCQQPLTIFGKNCVPTHRYGYAAGQPCMLLTFSLPQNYTVRALAPKDGQAYLDAERVLGDRFSTEHVGISCAPTTPEDKKYVGNDSGLGDAIEYNPKIGFPLYFFRQRTVDRFVSPAVMVQFRSIRDSLKKPHRARLTCTAWGKAMDPRGKTINEDMFTTTFVFRIH